MPSGPPQWPLRGGLLKQPGRLADAARVFADEWPHVMASRKAKAKAEASAAAPEPPPERVKRERR
jgi:hypothetical protein